MTDEQLLRCLQEEFHRVHVRPVEPETKFPGVIVLGRVMTAMRTIVVFRCHGRLGLQRLTEERIELRRQRRFADQGRVL